MKKNYKIYLIFIFAILIFILSLIYYNDKVRYVRPKFDENAISGIPELDDDDYKKISPEGLYNFSLLSIPKLNNNKLLLYFTNDGSNLVYLKVRIYKDDKIIGESDLIKPGEFIEYVNVNGVRKDDTVLIKVMSYNMNNYYSEGVVKLNVEID